LIASYGADCGVGNSGNFTHILKGECDGQRACDYAVLSAEFSDPCIRQPKAFDFAWTCSTQPAKLKEGHLDAEALGKIARLSCP